MIGWVIAAFLAGIIGGALLTLRFVNGVSIALRPPKLRPQDVAAAVVDTRAVNATLPVSDEMVERIAEDLVRTDGLTPDEARLVAQDIQLKGNELGQPVNW